MKVGYAFGDHIKTEKIKKRSYEITAHFSVRNFLLLFSIIGISAVLLFRIFYVQIVRGDYYQALSDVNRTRTKIIHAPRGVIFDRNNVPLVFNIPGYRQVEGKNIELLSHDQAISRLATGDKSIEVDSLRKYPFKEAMSHVIGYIGQINEDQLKESEYTNYQLNDLVGREGIEKEYEHILKGTDGKQLLEVNAMGQVVRTLGQTDPVPGKDIYVTIDSKLQQAAYDAMRDVQKGAIVASTPDGQILALLSKPSFDPNLFTLDKTYPIASDSAYKKISDILLDGTGQPLLNRAISGTYPPGSTFKIVAAAAGLESKVIDEKFSVEDTGVITIGTFSFANWYLTEYGKKEPGPVDVKRAIARSNDIFFYRLADMLKVDRLSTTGEKFGIGEKLGIDLEGEASGILPTKAWKEKHIGEQWYTGDTFHYGIGQGYLLTTPLQVNAWSQVIATGGTLYRPHLIKDAKPIILQSNIITSKTQTLVRDGMIAACATGGTAYPFFDFTVKNSDLVIDNKNFFAVTQATGSAQTKVLDPALRRVSVACKTGTAQQGGENDKPHAWITLFAPAENPQIVLTVLNESSGEGADKAAPAARKVLEEFFSKKN
jgi:penicillin-binding protein 2